MMMTVADEPVNIVNIVQDKNKCWRCEINEQERDVEEIMMSLADEQVIEWTKPKVKTSVELSQVNKVDEENQME